MEPAREGDPAAGVDSIAAADYWGSIIVVAEQPPPVATTLRPYGSGYPDPYGRPSKKAVHEAVRNVLVNEMGLTQTQLCTYVWENVELAVKQAIDARLETNEFRRLILNQVCQVTNARPGAAARATVSSAQFENELRSMLREVLKDLILPQLRVSLQIDPAPAERTRAVSLDGTQL